MIGLDLGKESISITELPMQWELFWQSKASGNQACAGEICLMHPLDAFLEREYPEPEALNMPDDLPKFTLDDSPHSGDNCSTLCSVNNEGNAFLLYYKYQFDVYLMDLSITEYYDIQKQVQGYRHWQLLFCMPDKTIVCRFGIAYFDRMLAKMKTIFGHQDLKLIEERYIKLCGIQ